MILQTQHKPLEPDSHSMLGSGIFILVSALLCLGALMVFSAGASIDQKPDWNVFWRFTTLRRIAFVPIIWIVMWIVSRMDYRRWILGAGTAWRRPILYMQILTLLLLVLVLIPGVGTEVNYSRRWLLLGNSQYGLRFQPSELAKWITMLSLACYIANKGKQIRKFWKGFVPAMLLLMAVTALIGIEDFGTAALLAAIGVFLLLIGGVRIWHLSCLIPLAAIGFYTLVYCNQYRWQRVLAYFKPNTQTAQDTAYQAKQSLMAIGSGGLWGTGLGQGTVKLGWLPEDMTDFIFAVIGEELGFLGCAMVIILFAGLILCSIQTARRTPDPTGRFIATAIGATLGAQALMNMMVVTEMVPTKGIALPFVSAGGSGLLMAGIAAGILINISRHRKNQLQ